MEMRSDLASATFRPVELRQLAVVVGVEYFALRIDQRGIVPASEWPVLRHGDLELVWPLPAQRHGAHPWHALQSRARIGEAQGEERSLELFANDRFQMRWVDAHKPAVDDDLPEGKSRLTHEPTQAGPSQHRQREHCQRQRKRIELARVIPHARLAGCRRKASRTGCRPAWRPWAPGC